MAAKRSVQRLALLLAVWTAATVLGSATASATELSDHLWQRRPLLVFAPTVGDSRLVETVGQIETDRCDFVERDMVLGVLVASGNSTLDGRPVKADEAQQLRDRYAVGPDAFSVLLIGKDGGVKLRTDTVPDLQTIYAVIDGMPMRTREMDAGSDDC